MGAMEEEGEQYQAGVRRLCEKGITRVPLKYILPKPERPCIVHHPNPNNLNLPIIDLAQLQGPDRGHVIASLAQVCQEYGFFQLINHGIGGDVIDQMCEVSKEFFELSFEERSKYMSSDMYSPVRYGTSFNQNNDKVFCWRDFLKLSCYPLSQALPHWPSSPSHLREAGVRFSKETRSLYLVLMEAIMESLGLDQENKEHESSDDSIRFEDGSQLMIMNCYPPCPEPELTLGMPAHSDYGFLTLLLQDEVEGLQIQRKGRWLTVQPLAGSFVVNVGDHLEIFSNGRYKSVVHRVTVNPSKSRISIASLHSLPFECMVRPSKKLIDEANPRRYKDTDFSSFLEHIASSEHKNKNFLESRKLTF